ncbi:alpha/beta hydrolase [Anaeromyxobacter dehalogenans]|uniref:Esterase/lipase/thioesterase family protein n=1 Tax=Anaeromyxobacter dehalogenans (strain 2CP-C) TaxID=290397 RepID=Q2IFB3_ANADE|nr:alpha/beta fold hydrolase [Anaeromyxobacter dehalogenans]ABC83268.1 esterase/lipase/thioesterase family protein [Anaeromyxobacter dehalogenans 2CP-C]
MTPTRSTLRPTRLRRLGVLLSIAAALAMCAPARAGRAPPADLDARPVELRSGSGSTIRGWLARGHPGAGAVLLLHGIGASAAEMAGRARFLAGAGYSVLAIDFRGHGASGSAQTTYGALESRDARAAVEWLRAALPGERIGVIGISMGGAAALLGAVPLKVDALVLESVYPTIDAAIRNRARAWLGPLGALLAPLVERLMLPRQGVRATDLRPVDRIGDQVAPLLVLAGAADPYTPLSESRALYRNARGPKALWEVPGAGHVDLHAFAPAEYERRVGGFLDRRLRAQTARAPAGAAPRAGGPLAAAPTGAATGTP